MTDAIIEKIDRKKKSDPKWLTKYYEELRQSSSAKQITVGALSGWSAGFISAKFGKTAATAVGGTILLLHFAQQYGYVTIDWKQVNKDVEKAKKEIERRASKDLPKFINKAQTFVIENVLLAGGFAGGFFLGLASA